MDVCPIGQKMLRQQVLSTRANMAARHPVFPYIVAGAAVGTGLFLWVIRTAKQWRAGSRTAQIACFMRLLATHEVEEAFKLRDPLAKHFVPPFFYWAATLAPNLTRRKYVDARLPGGYGWVLGRTKAYDAIVDKYCSDGATQLVILGAGYDARPYRLDSLKHVQVFEVDQPDTQSSKVEIVNRVVPKEQRQHVTFVPINFNKDKLEDVLVAAGFDKSQKTLFLWEAVTQYISSAAVESVLQFVRENSAPGSHLAFDYKYQEALDGTKSYTGTGIADIVKFVSTYEPYIFGIPEGTVGTFLAERGFDADQIITPSMIRDTVLTDPVSGRVITVMGFQDIVVAKVK